MWPVAQKGCASLKAEKTLTATEQHTPCTLATNKRCILAHFFIISRLSLPLELSVHGIWQRTLFKQTENVTNLCQLVFIIYGSMQDLFILHNIESHTSTH